MGREERRKGEEKGENRRRGEEEPDRGKERAATGWRDDDKANGVKCEQL